MAYTPKLTYKGKPLVRHGSEFYYGNMSDPYVLYLQVLSTKPEQNIEMADKITMMVLSTDTTKPLPERVMRRKVVNGLYNALDLGGIWLERALKVGSDEQAK